MNLFTFLVFILGLGSLNCETWVEVSPEISLQCEDKEGVGEMDLKDMDEMKVKCYYHCVYEKQGIIAKGLYVGKTEKCKGVKDANKCELARKVVECSIVKT